MNTILSPFRSPPLLFRASSVVVTRAPGPREVIWQNLSYSFLRSVIAEFLFIFVMVIVLLFSFRFQYRVVDLAYRLRHEGKKSGEFVAIIESLAMSLIVVIVNSLLRLLVIIVLCRSNFSPTLRNITHIRATILLFAFTTLFPTSLTPAS